MGEDVEARSRPVRQFVLPGDREQSNTANQRRIGFLYVFEFALKRCRRRPCGEDGSGDAASFEETAIPVAEPVELQLNHPREAVRNAKLDLSKRHAQGYLAIPLHHDLLRAQVIKRSDHEEGVACRVLMVRLARPGGSESAASSRRRYVATDSFESGPSDICS